MELTDSFTNTLEKLLPVHCIVQHTTHVAAMLWPTSFSSIGMHPCTQTQTVSGMGDEFAFTGEVKGSVWEKKLKWTLKKSLVLLVIAPRRSGLWFHQRWGLESYWSHMLTRRNSGVALKWLATQLRKNESHSVHNASVLSLRPKLLL